MNNTDSVPGAVPDVEAELTCIAVRWVDDEPQPGIAEVEFTDAGGRTWQVIEKSAVLDYGDTITPWASYPMPWRMRCFIVGNSDAAVCRIRLAHQIWATDGTSEFDVRRDQLTILNAGADPLPLFVYHPDPVESGSVTASNTVCVCCGRSRGLIYSGPSYAVDELEDCLCPWCIADGRAAERYEATFNDIGRIDPWHKISDDIVETISRRTPGFSGWQQERWLFHCNDGMQFLGLMGADELAAHPDAIAAIREEAAEFRWDDDLVEEYLSRLSTHGQPTAYVFRCRHCNAHMAYTDFT